MAVVHSKNSRVIVGDSHWSCYVTGVTSNGVAVDMIDVTTLCDTARNFEPGVSQHDLQLDGIFDGADSAESWYRNAIALPPGAAAVPWSFAPNGYAEGETVLLGQAYAAGFTPSAAAADVVKYSLSLRSTDEAEWGYALHNYTTVHSTSSNETGLTQTASSNGGASVLHVVAGSGGNLVVKVQHSTNGSTWADLITHTTATGATSERKEVTGTVNAYVRALWTISAGTTWQFALSFARR